MALGETKTGLSPIHDATINEACEQLRHLLACNWNSIQEVRDFTEDATVKVGFGLSLNFAGKKPIVTGKLRFTKTFTDEGEGAVVEDPRQSNLPLDGDDE